VTDKPAVTLREVRRGVELNEVELVLTDNRVLILVGYGLTPDEQIRVREAALKILTSVVTQ
jgi:hypothetical protein